MLALEKESRAKKSFKQRVYTNYISFFVRCDKAIWCTTTCIFAAPSVPPIYIFSPVVLLLRCLHLPSSLFPIRFTSFCKNLNILANKEKHSHCLFGFCASYLNECSATHAFHANVLVRWNHIERKETESYLLEIHLYKYKMCKYRILLIKLNTWWCWE